MNYLDALKLATSLLPREERRHDYHCRVRVAVVKSWLRKGYLTPDLVESVLTHWRVSPDSIARIIATAAQLDAAEICSAAQQPEPQP